MESISLEISQTEAIYVSDAESDGISFLGGSGVAGPSRPILYKPAGPAAVYVDSSEDDDIPLSGLKELHPSSSSRVDLTGSSPPRMKSRKDKGVDDLPGRGHSGSNGTARPVAVMRESLFDRLDAEMQMVDGDVVVQDAEAGRTTTRRLSEDASLGEGESQVTKTKKRKSTEGPEKTDDQRAKRSAKEVEKTEKIAAREAAKAAKAAEKAEKEAEKLQLKQVREVNRLRTSKTDAIRELHMYLSPSLSEPSSLLHPALAEIEARLKDNLSELHYLPADMSPINNLIRFKRHVKARWDQQSKRFVPIHPERWDWEDTVLVLIDAEEVTDLVSLGESKLRDWAGDVRLSLGMAKEGAGQVFVMIKGMGKYHAKTKMLKNREFTAAARREVEDMMLGGEDGPEVARVEAGREKGSAKGKSKTVGSSTGRPNKDQVERELATMQLGEKVFIVHVEKTEDMEDWIWNLAADIALRPYKLLSKSHLAFAPTEHARKAHSPTDCLELMLQEVQGVTESAARGIAREYGTFKELMLGFEKAEAKGGVGRGEGLLADCEIRNLKNGTASGRKFNKALAKKVYHAFRGTDSLALA